MSHSRSRLDLLAQPGPDRYRFYPGDRISDDQRKLLKDRTGFESYTSYLINYTRKYSSYGALLDTWLILDNRLELPRTRYSRYDCDIFDITKDEDSSINISECYRTSSHVELFTILSEPQKGLYARIMFWRTPKSHSCHSAFLEDLGLALNISPAFFKSVYDRGFSSGFCPVITPSHVVIGDRVATMTRCCINEKSSAVPIVFIADTTDPELRNSEEVNSVFHQRMQPDRHVYTMMRIIEQNSVFSTSANTLILPAMLAALRLDAAEVRWYCETFSNGRYNSRPESIEDINKERDQLHRRIEDFEETIQDARTYFSSLYGADWSHEYNCESIFEYFKLTINRARRFEDHHIGLLSLEESKKSIELSMSQIEEGKRVKIFTILAFVYVPLNLATSIFGMNIQQLNSSGQAVQTFLATAVILLLLTGGFWLCIEEVNEYRSWSRIDRPRHRNKDLVYPQYRPTYNIVVRVMMLVWLYRNGHWAWVRKTEAWRDILANRCSNRRFASRLSNVIHPLDMKLSAGDYVSEYMGTRDHFNAFKLHEERNEGVIIVERISS